MSAYFPKRVVLCLAGLIILVLSTSLLHAGNHSGRSCLFKVTSPGSTIYLLGSIHFMREASYPLNDAIEKAFAVSTAVVFEVDMAEMDSPDTQVLMLSQSVFADGRTLGQSLSPDVYRRLGERLTEFGIDVAVFSHFKPWSVAMTLIGLKLNQLGFDPAKGIDRYFYARALDERKRTYGLETLRYQIGIFDSLSPQEQEFLVRQTLDDYDAMELQMGDMMLAWTNGDTANLEKMLLKSFTDYPELYRKFIVRRNHNWLSQIELFLKRKQHVFFVVGAGHLLGSEGLVNLLRQRGYEVEQL